MHHAVHDFFFQFHIGVIEALALDALELKNTIKIEKKLATTQLRRVGKLDKFDRILPLSKSKVIKIQFSLIFRFQSLSHHQSIHCAHLHTHTHAGGHIRYIGRYAIPRNATTLNGNGTCIFTCVRNHVSTKFWLC